MELHLGETVKALRKRDNRTQEQLASALGITFQAVSRWESGVSYPDMELIPAIANYFGITIDALFGYDCARDRLIDNIIARVDAYSYKSDGGDGWVDDCIAILRKGLAQFPQNERLTIKLADVLIEAGWRRHREWLYYDEEGYMRHDYDKHKKNPYWREGAGLCETLIETAKDPETVYSALATLIMLYRNFGENEKAAAFANRLPYMNRCRELQLCCSYDSKEEARCIGELLLTMAGHFSTQVVYGIINNLHHYETDAPIDKIKGCIALFDLICEDGNYGEYHGNLVELYLYLSSVQWRRGHHDDAFLSLDAALSHAQKHAAVSDGNVHRYTSMLTEHVSFVSPATPPHLLVGTLPEQWPVWCNPDYTEVEKEMKADPRWNIWVGKCKGEIH